MTDESSQSRVLIVHENRRKLQALAGALRSLGQPMVLAASTDEAVRALFHQEYAAIVINLDPRKIERGFETADLIRKHNKSKETPIIFLVSRPDDPDVLSTVYAINASDILIKPLMTAEIFREKVAVYIQLDQARRAATGKKRGRPLVQDLEAALERTRRLTEDGPTRLTEVPPLREFLPNKFDDFVLRYQDLLDRYLEYQVFNLSKPRDHMKDLASRLGDLGAQPRDLIDVHSHALEATARRVSRARAGTYAIEGRLLALEIMGYLVDYYREGRLKSAKKK